MNSKTILSVALFLLLAVVCTWAADLKLEDDQGAIVIGSDPSDQIAIYKDANAITVNAPVTIEEDLTVSSLQINGSDILALLRELNHTLTLYELAHP